MSARETVEQSFVVGLDRERFLAACEHAFAAESFVNIRVSRRLGRIAADFDRFTTTGTVYIAAVEDGDGTRVTIRTVACPPVMPSFERPARKLIERFRRGLSTRASPSQRGVHQANSHHPGARFTGDDSSLREVVQEAS